MPHVWGSSSWDPRDRWQSEASIGEQRETVTWSRPTLGNPRVLGTGWCGSDAVMRGETDSSMVGTPAVDAEGVPTCCPQLEWRGGSEGGGGHVTWPLYPFGHYAPGAGPSVLITVSDPPGLGPTPGLPFSFRAAKVYPFQQYMAVVAPPSGPTLHWNAAPIAVFLAAVEVYQDGDTPVTVPISINTAPPSILDAQFPLPQLAPHLVRIQMQEVGPPEGYGMRPSVQVNFESQKQATDIRSRLGDDGFGQPYHLGLYVGDQLLPANLTFPGITEASFPGYARIPLSGLWTQALIAGNVYLIAHPEVFFTCTGGTGQLVGGWFIISATGVPRLRWIRPLPGGLTLVANPGQLVPVTPEVTVRSQYAE